MTDAFHAIDNVTDFPIILVEDDPQVYELLNQIARQEFPQCRFVYKSSFEQAITYLQQLRGWSPRLFILDIDLKQPKSGLDLLDWLRASDAFRLVPIVMLSVVHEEAIVRDAYARGANAFTGKPFTLDEWREYVRYLRSYWYEMASTPKLWLGSENANEAIDKPAQ